MSLSVSPSRSVALTQPEVPGLIPAVRGLPIGRAFLPKVYDSHWHPDRMPFAFVGQGLIEHYLQTDGREVKVPVDVAEVYSCIAIRGTPRNMCDSQGG